jgi:hypothetical protein
MVIKMPDEKDTNFDLLELTEREIDLESVMIDPNNPRLLEMGSKGMSDERITEEEIQKEALKNMKDDGVNDIKEKVKRFGFLSVDKVVVRPIQSESKCLFSWDISNPSLIKEVGREFDKDLTDAKVEKLGEEEMTLEKDQLKFFLKLCKSEGILKVILGDLEKRYVVKEESSQINIYRAKYVVVEGNRRITSLKSLLDDHVRGRETLNEKVLSSLKIFKVLVYEGTDKDIVWKLQGIRHIKGVKEWGPLQQGIFLSDMQERKKLKLNDLAEMTAIKRATVTQLIRSYNAWKQAKNDEDFGDKINSGHFSLFNEAVFTKPKLREWLDWNDDEKQFKNSENFKKLLGWYLGEEGVNNGESRLQRVNPDVRDILSQLLLEENKSLFEKFDNDDIQIDEVRSKLEEAKAQKEIQEVKVDLDLKLDELDRMATTLQTLPLPKIIEKTEKIDSFIEKLDIVEKNAKMQTNILNKMKAPRE